MRFIRPSAVRPLVVRQAVRPAYIASLADDRCRMQEPAALADVPSDVTGASLVLVPRRLSGPGLASIWSVTLDQPTFGRGSIADEGQLAKVSLGVEGARLTVVGPAGGQSAPDTETRPCAVRNINHWKRIPHTKRLLCSLSPLWAISRTSGSWYQAPDREGRGGKR